MTTFLQDYRPVFMTATFALLAGAFYVTYRPGRSAVAGPRSRIMAFNRIMLWMVTAVAVVLLFVPPAFFSPADSGDKFTADMQRTVIQIEGMT